MWRIMSAELRRWLNVQVGTLLIGICFAAVAFFIEAENTATHGTPLDMRDTRLLFSWLFFCAAPVLVGWYWNLSWNVTSTFRLVDTLPLSRARLNLVRMLVLLIQFAPVVIVWLLHYAVLNHFDRVITPWLAIGLFFFVVFWAVAALNHTLFWAGMWAVVVLTVIFNTIDRWELQVSLPVTVSAVCTVTVFAVLTAGVAWWTIRRGAPRRTV